MPYLDHERYKANYRAYNARMRDITAPARRLRYQEDAEYREKILARNKAWRTRNRSAYVKAAVKAQQRRYHSNPEFKLKICLRARLKKAVLGNLKSAPTMELIGCTIPELRTHLESLFVPGMTWENYGPVWHVDHKKPCAKFDLSDPAQQRECFGWRNLQPLFAQENLMKAAKYVQ